MSEKHSNSLQKQIQLKLVLFLILILQLETFWILWEPFQIQAKFKLLVVKKQFHGQQKKKELS
jgi:hypothetical protein